jgi:ATP-binding cassette subfamily B protein
VERQIEKIRALLQWAGKDKYYLYLSILTAFISGLCTMIPYYAIYKLIDEAYSGLYTKEKILSLALIVVVGVIIRFLLFGMSGALSHKGAYNTLYKVRCLVIEHMAKVPLGRLSERNTGQIKTVLNEDIEKLELFLAHHLPELVYYTCGPIAVFIYLCKVNIILAIISLIPFIIAILIIVNMFKKSENKMKEANLSIANLNAVMIEYINGMKLIKAYKMGSSSFKKFSDAVNNENKIWNEISRKMGPSYAAYVVIVECGILLMVPIGGYLFLKGSISASVFLLFVFIGSLYLSELRPLQELATNFAAVLNAVSKVRKILSTEVYKAGVEFPQKHDIVLNDVYFSYDGHRDILKKCNLKINDKEKIALVGKSGAGKSTIIELISRFYDVDKGSIKIAGINVKDIDYEQLLDNTGIVFQKSFLTRDSILENIKMGLDATLEDVREAARKAQIDELIMSLPEQYNTNMGNYGTRFSGGEKQRIAIARAILKNPPILILDEATSAADPENQFEIDKAIKNLCTDKTVIIVAHRLGIVRMCNKVAVVENNTISFVGTHEEALIKNKYYSKTWSDYNKSRTISYEMGMRYE